MKVYEVLIDVRAGEKPKKKGICWLLDNHDGFTHESLLGWIENRADAYEAWWSFNGDYLYPVDGKYEFYNSEDLWENPKRHELLDHLIEWFKERDI